MNWHQAGLALALITAPIALAPQAAKAQAFVGIAVVVAPPALPVYVQPPIPGPGYIWTPGYWGWDPVEADYYWIPGTWILAPQPGYLWTPGYWGWDEGRYFFHAGYWGPHVGFYGGVPYGFGYTGEGYEGGYWQGPHFYYNRTVNNFGGVHITNVYNRTVIVNQTYNRISYNGGPRGIDVRPSPADIRYEHGPHIGPTETQDQHFAAARQNRAEFYNVNHGRPAIAATSRPGVFHGAGVVPEVHARPPGTNPYQGPNGQQLGHGPVVLHPNAPVGQATGQPGARPAGPGGAPNAGQRPADFGARPGVAVPGQAFHPGGGGPASEPAGRPVGVAHPANPAFQQQPRPAAPAFRPAARPAQAPRPQFQPQAAPRPERTPVPPQQQQRAAPPPQGHPGGGQPQPHGGPGGDHRPPGA